MACVCQGRLGTSGLSQPVKHTACGLKTFKDTQLPLNFPTSNSDADVSLLSQYLVAAETGMNPVRSRFRWAEEGAWRKPEEQPWWPLPLPGGDNGIPLGFIGINLVHPPVW